MPSNFTLPKPIAGTELTITDFTTSQTQIETAIRDLQDATANNGSVTSVSDVDTDVAELFTTSIANSTTTPTTTFTRSTKAANYVYASPNGSSGKGSFRALVAADLPTIPYTKGGTGLTTIGAAYQMTRVDSAGTAIEWFSLAGGSSKVTITPSAGQAAIDIVPSEIEVNDLKATTPLSIAKGGTSAATAQLAINALTAVSGATNGDVLTKVAGAVAWAAQSVGITSVNSLTGASITLDTDDIAEGSTNKYNATHTGDVTGATALTIATQAVTYAKMQNISATKRILGRVTAAAGVTEEIKVEGNLALNSTSIISKLSKVRTITGSEAIVITDGTVLLNGTSITSILPDTATIAIGDEFIIKNLSGATTNTISVYNAGTDLIDGETSYALTSAFDCVWIKYVSANRFSIISKIVNV